MALGSTTFEPALARKTPGYVIITATVLACLPILAISQFANLARIDDIDAIFFAYYGRRLLAGQQLYVELWDNKPPGIFWIDAIGLWISRGEFWGVALVVSLATVGTAVTFFLTARRLFGLASGAVGTAMACLYVNLYYYHVGANRPSTFYVFFELCVLFFYCRSFEAIGSRRRDRFLAGASAACAMGFRQTAVSVLGSVVVHQAYLMLRRRQTRAELLAVIAPVAAGGVTVAAIVVAILWWTSDLGWAWHGAVASNLGYLVKSKQSRVIPTELFHWADHIRVLGLPAVLGCAAVIHTLATAIFVGSITSRTDKACVSNDGTPVTRARFREPGGPPAAFVLLAAWVPIGLYLALIGPHRAHHYYGIALPPLVMLATYGVWLLMRRDDDRDRAPRYYVILAVLWFVYMAVPVGRLQVRSAMLAHFQRFDDRSVDRWAPIVEAIERHTQPDARVHSMRYLPLVFWKTNRAQAQRYLLDTLIDQWDEGAQRYVDEVIADLKAAPPDAIIASPSDIKEMQQPRTPISYRDLHAWLEAHYTLVRAPPKSGVWIRKSLE